MLKLENSIRGLSFSRVAFDLTIQDIKTMLLQIINLHRQRHDHKFLPQLLVQPYHYDVLYQAS